MDYQKIILVGNVTDDPDVRQSKSGEVDFTTFRLAVSNGKEKALFFPVTAFGKLGETISLYVKKGQQLLVEGRINFGEMIQFNIIADRVRFGAQPTNPNLETETEEEEK